MSEMLSSYTSLVLEASSIVDGAMDGGTDGAMDGPLQTPLVKSQTPLVNLGYASRSSNVLQSISSFGSGLTSQWNLVILGSGYDPVGIWATLRYPRVKVWEIDNADVVSVKAAMLSKARHYDSSRHFILPPCDLNQSFPSFFKTSVVDTTFPTLFLSELVLSYVSESGVSAILDTIADVNGTLVAYELRTPPPTNKPPTNSTIVRHGHNYKAQFAAKLCAGSSNNTSSNNTLETTSTFTTPTAITAKLSSHGFLPPTIVDDTDLKPIGPFDEHAAMHLYLKSYMLITAQACPTLGLRGASLPINNTKLVTLSTLPPTQERDSLQSAATSLVTLAYRSLSEAHAPVRRMIKSAVKSELGDLHNYYGADGDVFYVVLDETTEDVVACIGVKVWVQGKGGENVYTIKRLVVHPGYRRRGLGKLLLEKVMKDKNSVTFEATTVTVASEAMALYERLGWEKKGEDEIEGMVLVTWARKGGGVGAATS
jgi:ribosomal protein S18 acetylase RimI-like enzyme